MRRVSFVRIVKLTLVYLGALVLAIGCARPRMLDPVGGAEVAINVEPTVTPSLPGRQTPTATPPANNSRSQETGSAPRPIEPARSEPTCEGNQIPDSKGVCKTLEQISEEDPAARFTLPQPTRPAEEVTYRPMLPDRLADTRGAPPVQTDAPVALAQPGDYVNRSQAEIDAAVEAAKGTGPEAQAAREFLHEVGSSTLLRPAGRLLKVRCARSARDAIQPRNGTLFDGHSGFSLLPMGQILYARNLQHTLMDQLPALERETKLASFACASEKHGVQEEPSAGPQSGTEDLGRFAKETIEVNLAAGEATSVRVLMRRDQPVLNLNLVCLANANDYDQRGPSELGLLAGTRALVRLPFSGGGLRGVRDAVTGLFTQSPQPTAPEAGASLRDRSQFRYALIYCRGTPQSNLPVTNSVPSPQPTIQPIEGG